MIQSSLMSASQNSWMVWLVPTTTGSRFLPGIIDFAPVTVSRSTCAGVHPSGREPAVPGSNPVFTRQMVDPVSTKALQGCPSTTQLRYNPWVVPQRPTVGQSGWRGNNGWGEGPLSASLPGRFPPVWGLGLGRLWPGDRVPHIGNSGHGEVSVGAPLLVGHY